MFSTGRIEWTNGKLLCLNNKRKKSPPLYLKKLPKQNHSRILHFTFLRIFNSASNAPTFYPVFWLGLGALLLVFWWVKFSLFKSAEKKEPEALESSVLEEVDVLGNPKAVVHFDFSNPSPGISKSSVRSFAMFLGALLLFSFLLIEERSNIKPETKLDTGWQQMRASDEPNIDNGPWQYGHFYIPVDTTKQDTNAMNILLRNQW